METYYIIKILKIKELTETVKKVADTHHHHKLILYFQIPKFEESEEQVIKDTEIHKNYLRGSEFIIVNEAFSEKNKLNLFDTYKNVYQLNLEKTEAKTTLNVMRKLAIEAAQKAE